MIRSFHMRSRLALSALVLLAGFGLLIHSASARPIMSMTLNEQFEKASLVVIGVPASTEDEGMATPSAPNNETISVLTVFDVEAVVQGNLPPSTNQGRRQVTVRHRRYVDPRAEIEVVDGPQLVQFNPRRKNAYMMFLKLNDAGVYEPLTGQYDPALSFFLLKGYRSEEEKSPAEGR